MTCDWCGKELDGWFYRYKDLTFCEKANGRCLKEFLFAEHLEEIKKDKVVCEIENK